MADESVLLDNHLKYRLFSSIPNSSKCPKKNKTLPTEPCDWALNSIYKTGPKECRCDWFVIHSDSNYCFWAFSFLQRIPQYTKVAQAFGGTYPEIAVLTGDTSSRIFNQIEKILAKIRSQSDETSLY